MGSAELAGREVRQHLARALREFAVDVVALPRLAGAEPEYVYPPAILDRIHEGLARIDFDPESAWSAEDVMSLEEAEVLFNRAHLGAMVIMETAWSARQILARWPSALVEPPFPDGDRINGYFTGGPPFGPEPDNRGRHVINRALASPSKVLTHPELAELDDDQLLLVWLAVVYWFTIKSVALNQWARSASHE
jgi:hypothetical protein